MSAPIKLCDLDAVPRGEMRPIDVDGLPPLAVYNVDGTLYVTSNLCTHNVALLTDGYLTGDIVECPLHGGCFNVRTGAATEFPCEKPLQTYAVEIRDGVAYLAQAAKENAP